MQEYSRLYLQVNLSSIDDAHIELSVVSGVIRSLRQAFNLHLVKSAFTRMYHHIQEAQK